MPLSFPRPITDNASPPGGAAAAILIVPDGHYLMQLRDDKPDVWDPGCWGCFGGSIDERETPESALRRELSEELELRATLQFRYFTQVAWDYGPWGRGVKLRYYFEVVIGNDELARVVLHEGQAFRLFSAEEVLREPRLTAYDSHALRMHIRIGIPR
jgi:8-oxo-dGTP pyrophosphatase MutT (NUDIX family)